MPRKKQDLSRTVKKKEVVAISPEKYSALVTTQLKNLGRKVKFYKCCACGSFSDEPKNFIQCYSSLCNGNEHYLPYCKDCINSLFENFLDNLKEEKQALQRTCMMLDIYYNEKILESMKTRNKDRIITMTDYISKVNSQTQKTYGDTIAEELKVQKALETASNEKKVAKKESEYANHKKFWGEGFSFSEYDYLQTRYEEWISRNECKTQAQETIFKTISLIEMQILKAIQNGEKVDNLYKQLNDYMGSANIKPNQKNDNAFADNQCFGTLIEKFEQTRPIPESKPSEIEKYISVWFLGHLCKMLNIKNKWSDLYQEEISKYTCSPPDYKDTDISELSYEDIFGSDGQ